MNFVIQIKQALDHPPPPSPPPVTPPPPPRPPRAAIPRTVSPPPFFIPPPLNIIPNFSDIFCVSCLTYASDFEESTESQPTPSIYKGISSTGVPRVSKKSKQKKTKSASSSDSLSASSRQSRSTKSKAAYSEREATPISQK
ncbi:hypothetical protein Fmac_010995 [Flemingia macrophylla]|uniref:Uncharacterized protein n=1 Tax=Flemingia macrophylla TaxID=520843 RepID=A0ABD1ML73_9FABA